MDTRIHTHADFSLNNTLMHSQITCSRLYFSLELDFHGVYFVCEKLILSLFVCDFCGDFRPFARSLALQYTKLSWINPAKSFAFWRFCVCTQFLSISITYALMRPLAIPRIATEEKKEQHTHTHSDWMNCVETKYELKFMCIRCTLYHCMLIATFHTKSFNDQSRVKNRRIQTNSREKKHTHIHKMHTISSELAFEKQHIFVCSSSLLSVYFVCSAWKEKRQTRECCLFSRNKGIKCSMVKANQWTLTEVCCWEILSIETSTFVAQNIRGTKTT